MNGVGMSITLSLVNKPVFLMEYLSMFNKSYIIVIFLAFISFTPAQTALSWLTDLGIYEVVDFADLDSDDQDVYCDYLGYLRDEVLYEEFDQAFALTQSETLQELLDDLEEALDDVKSSSVGRLLNALNATASSIITVAGITATATGASTAGAIIAVIGIGASTVFLVADAVRISIYYPDDAADSLRSSSTGKVISSFAAVGGTAGDMLSGAGTLLSAYNLMQSNSDLAEDREVLESIEIAIEQLRRELEVSQEVFENATEDGQISNYLYFVNYKKEKIDEALNAHCR